MKVGMRKYTFGVLSIILLWVIAMWAPGIDAATRQACVNAMWLDTGLVVGGLVGENWAARRPAEKAAD